MADDDFEDLDLDFEGNDDEPDSIDYEDNPSPELTAKNARRELEKRLEMKRLKEMLDYTEIDDDI